MIRIFHDHDFVVSYQDSTGSHELVGNRLFSRNSPCTFLLFLPDSGLSFVYTYQERYWQRNATGWSASPGGTPI